MIWIWDCFGDERDVTMGIELEGYLFEDVDGRWFLVDDEDKTMDFVSEFDDRVYKDYYPYQLEIRTHPHNDPVDLATEVVDLLREVYKKGKERGMLFVPMSRFMDAMFCGMHIHMTSKDINDLRNMVSWMRAIYPLVFPIVRMSVSSPYQDYTTGKYLSYRIAYSQHIAPTRIFKSVDSLIQDFSEGGSHRYKDIVLNFNRREGRHRVKDVVTVEIRMFDSVGDKQTIRAIIHSLYTLAKYVRMEWIADALLEGSVNRLSLEFFYNAIKLARRILTQSEPYIDPFTGMTVPDFLNVLRDYESIPYTEFEGSTMDNWLYVIPFDYETGFRPEIVEKYIPKML